MTEAGGETLPEPKAGATRRNLLIALTAVPIAAFFALLVWAVAESGGTPGGFGINDKFGEVSVAGGPAPQFAKETLGGGMIDLSELRGKVVMLDFWSSWCPPCRREAPALAQVYRDYQGANIEFIGVAIWDDPKEVTAHIRKFELSYPNLLDERGEIAIDYGIVGIPEKFFIDAHGNLVRKFVGPTEPELLRKTLDELLAASITQVRGE